MTKVPGHLGPRKRTYRPDADQKLAELAKQAISETEPGRRENAKTALSEYLLGLNDQEIEHVSHEWLLLPRKDLEDVYSAFHELDGLAGPARRLMKAMVRAKDEWLDTLPEEPDPAGLAFEAYLREQAAADGTPPDVVDGAVALWRRQGKWAAACDAVTSAENEARILERNDKLRAALPKVARLSDRLAKRLIILSLHPEKAAAIRDGVMFKVLDAMTEAVLAGAPHCWRDSGVEALEMLQAFADGKTRDPRWIEATVGDLRAVAKECRTAAESAPRERKRPRKPALDGADALEAGGRDWEQVAVILNERGLRLNPHTPRNISKSVSARRLDKKRK